MLFTDSNFNYVDGVNLSVKHIDDNDLHDDNSNDNIAVPQNEIQHKDISDFHDGNLNDTIVVPNYRDSDDGQSSNETSDENFDYPIERDDDELKFAINDWVIIQRKIFGKDMKIIGQIINIQQERYTISCVSYVEPFKFTFNRQWCEDTLEVSEPNIIHKLSSKVREHDGCVIFSYVPMWDYE